MRDGAADAVVDFVAGHDCQPFHTGFPNSEDSTLELLNETQRQVMASAVRW